MTKQLVDAAASGAPPAILDALAAGFISGTDDLAEGVAAFREKRPPRFNQSLASPVACGGLVTAVRPSRD